jgi:hypothetical protein
VTARPISIRWISLVPSKIVKILAVRAVSAGQRPIRPLVSARIKHALSEMNVGFRPGRVWFRAWYERTPSRTVSLLAVQARQTTPLEVYRRYILALTCLYAVGQGTQPCGQRRADGPHTGRIPGGCGNLGLAVAVVPTRRRDGPDGMHHADGGGLASRG